ncbi:MAG TPA: regulatory protein RecX [Nitriliruptorales bacterium]|nr:regulatory protein RecX [Nitriliruptorales bacterium]
MTDRPDASPFADAEAWLAARGVPRQALGVRPAEADPVQRLAQRRTQDLAQPRLEEQVADALRYARRSTAAAPRSEARLREALERRFPPAVAAVALERARAQGIVDDRAFAVALVEEARRRGHAPLRIRTTLERRGLPQEVIDPLVADVEDTDPEAAAFAVAARRVAALRGTDPETAFRRLVAFLARRGYTEALSRKVARQVVFHDREAQRTAER